MVWILFMYLITLKMLPFASVKGDLTCRDILSVAPKGENDGEVAAGTPPFGLLGLARFCDTDKGIPPSERVVPIGLASIESTVCAKFEPGLAGRFVQVDLGEA